MWSSIGSKVSWCQIQVKWNSNDLVVIWFEIQVIWLSSDLRFKRFWLSSALRFKWFGCQMIWDSSDSVVNWFEIQVIWLSIDLRFKWFGCRMVWDLSDLDVEWFEMSKIKFWSSKMKLYCETSFIFNFSFKSDCSVIPWWSCGTCSCTLLLEQCHPTFGRTIERCPVAHVGVDLLGCLGFYEASRDGSPCSQKFMEFHPPHLGRVLAAACRWHDRSPATGDGRPNAFDITFAEFLHFLCLILNTSRILAP